MERTNCNEIFILQTQIEIGNILISDTYANIRHLNKTTFTDFIAVILYYLIPTFKTDRDKIRKSSFI